MNTTYTEAPTASDFTIIKKRALQKIVISAILAFVGIILTFVSRANIEWMTKPIQMTMLTAGVILFIIGLFKLIWGSQQTIDAATGKVIRTCNFNYATSELNRVMYLIESKNFKLLKELKQMPNAGLQLEIHYSADKQFAGFRLYEFRNFSYEPASVVYRFEGDDAEKILSFLDVK